MPSVTVTYDATPIPTPANLPALPAGTFGMPLMSNRVSSTCFNDTEQSQAWNCDLVIFSGLSLTVERAPNGVEFTSSLGCNESLTLARNVYSYGEQPPAFPPRPLQLVNDTFQPSRGPAWFSMAPYNKTVVLPEKVLHPTGPPTATLDSREIHSFGSGGDLQRKSIAQVGDRPWVCTWPNTYLELFIYPLQNSSYNRPPKPSPSSDSPESSITEPPAAIPTASRGNPFGGDGPYIVPMSGSDEDDDDPETSTVAPTATSVDIFGPIDTDLPDMPPPAYPRVVKMEERRAKTSLMPMCRQVIIKGDGLPAVPVIDGDGNEVVIYIAENEPTPPSEQQKTALSKKDHLEADNFQSRDSGSELSDCGCLWFLT